MSYFVYPNPVIDTKEKELLKSLATDYEKFTSQGFISKVTRTVSNEIVKRTPDFLKLPIKKATNQVSKSEFINQALIYAGKGFVELTKCASSLSISHNNVLQSIKNHNYSLNNFEQICAVRSYHIEKELSSRNIGKLITALLEGAVTGAPGLLGVPFNIALSFFLFFRAVQSTAMFYGYDIKGEPRELEFASEVTIKCLSPNPDDSTKTMGGLIGKMMLATELTALKQSLSSMTYSEMAKKGGAELLYVQIRSLANKTAEKALNNAGQQGLEAGMFKKILVQVGKRLSKDAGKKAIPILGAIIGGLSDTYSMSQILKGSNLIYHKRFLFEKEHRLNILCQTQ